MKKKILLVSLCLIFAVTCLAALSACGENTKADAIATEKSGDIYSNGGLAVVYGKYLYFINGLAEAADDNNFGEVVSGAIARVELDGNKKPVESTLQIIVPKKAFGTDTTTLGGLYIVNDYVYYTTTSLDKDKDGKYKTSELVLMRTKVDGTDTKVIKKFESDTITYKVSKDYILLYNSTEATISRIDLNTKKFKETVVAESVSTSPIFTVTPFDGVDVAMNNYLFYQKNDEKTSSVKNLYVVSVDKSIENGKAVITNDMLKASDAIAAEKDSTYDYTLTLSNICYTDNNTVTVFYTLTDTLLNTPSAGLYSCKFDSSFEFNASNVVRYTRDSSTDGKYNYTKQYVIDGNVFLFTGTRLDVCSADFKIDTDKMKTFWELAEAVTAYNFVKFTGEKAGLYFVYLQSDVYKMIKVMDLDENGKVANNVTSAEGNAIAVMSSKASTTWLSAELINGYMYYFGSSLSDNICFFPFDVYSVPGIGEEDAREVRLLGTLTDADKQGLVG